MNMGLNMLQSGIKKLSYEDYTEGLKAVLEGSKPALSMDEAAGILNKYFEEIEAEQKADLAEVASAFKAEGEKFLKENSAKEGVKVLPSGLQYKVVTEGKGRHPKASDRVRCHYEGRFTDGQVFDSSYRRGEPAVFGLKQVIAGWTEGLQLMAEGSKYELYIPYQLGYGEMGSSGAIPPCAALVFTVELLEVL